MIARDLILGGYCTPQCLLALVDGGSCKCRCDGQGHGLLADAEVDVDTAGIEPIASLSPARPVNCHSCGKTIGKSRSHVIILDLDDLEVWCIDCFSPARGSRQVHARTYPGCPHLWHDMYDHASLVGNRSAAAAALDHASRGLPWRSVSPLASHVTA